MKKYPARFLATCLAISTALAPSPATAQIPVYTGIRTENFNFFASSQRNSNWCWAASIQMIFNYYGVSISQEQIVARSYGTDPYGNLPNWTGSTQLITANLNNWNIDNQGRAYAVNASMFPGPPSPAYLVRELDTGRPVLVGYVSGPGTGHAVVITACSYVPTPQGPIIQTLVVRDPWPSPQNVANLGRVEYPGSVLAQRIMAHWYVRVQ